MPMDENASSGGQAASAASAQISESGVAARYANALFDLGLGEGAETLASIEADFKTLSAAIAGSDDLRGFLKSPVYGGEEKRDAIAAIAERAGLAPLTKNFLGLVATNLRLFALEDMIAAFFKRMSAHRGEVNAEAVSAAPLNDDQAKRLRGEIERYVGKAVNLETKVDPELLGGLVVKVGSMMVDSSLRSKLNRLKSQLKEA